MNGKKGGDFTKVVRSNFYNYFINKTMYVLSFWRFEVPSVSREFCSIDSCILYFPIPHNALCLPPKICISYCCEMLLGGLHTAVLRKAVPQKRISVRDNFERYYG